MQLTRVMLPFLPLVALAAAAMGMLNALRQFTVPALAPALLNLGMIVVGVALIPVFRRFGQPPILAMAVGVLIGGFLQFAVQLPALFKLGWRPAWPPALTHPGVRRVAILMLPATIGLAATQLNLFVSTILASQLPQGSVSWLSYAFRLMQLPIGVFGVALATVSLPAVARGGRRGTCPRSGRTLSGAIRLVFVLTVPATFGLWALAQPLVALLYEHGRFERRRHRPDRGRAASYCIGLPAFAAVSVLVPTFYALGDTRTPVQASFVSVAVNLALNLLLMRPLGHVGLALSTSLTMLFNFAQLSFYLRRKLGRLEGRRMALDVPAHGARVGGDGGRRARHRVGDRGAVAGRSARVRGRGRVRAPAGHRFDVDVLSPGAGRGIAGARERDGRPRAEAGTEGQNPESSRPRGARRARASRAAAGT